MIPEEFIEYFFRKRVDMIRKLCEGVELGNFLLEFTRTTPVVITYGPAGLSGSVKMVGFLPKGDLINELAEKAFRYAYIEKPPAVKDVACVLMREFYKLELLDMNSIGGLEMGFKHSWENIRATGKATLLFYTPPNLSYEVRCDAEIHENPEDPYVKYLNSLHDLFHRGGGRSNYPAYVFKIREIYDNSARREGFGRKIYP